MSAPGQAAAGFGFRPGERESLPLRVHRHAQALRGWVIAIDGPAASGKTTTARGVARALGLRHLDTGALYRALTLASLRAQVHPEDAAGLVRLLQSTPPRLEPGSNGPRVFLQREEVTEAIRAPAVTAAVSQVSALREVRQAMLSLQQEVARQGGTVMEGRDIGTVVLPQADLKIFLTADVGARAARRQQEEMQRGRQRSRDDVEAEIMARDRADSTRAHAPLQRAPDAIELDTTGLSVEAQVDAVVALALRRLESSLGLEPHPYQALDWGQPGYRHFHSFHYRLAHVCVGTFLRQYCGIRRHAHPSARLPGGTLVACNHIAGFDPPVVGACLPFEVWWVAKEELFRRPLVGAFLRAYNAYPIRRGTADYDSLNRAVELLRAGRNVLMFPEGTRQKQGRLGTPRWGFGYVALRAGRPIVPVFVRGTGDGRPRMLRREPLEVRLGEAFAAPDLPDDPESYRILGELAMERIAGLMLRSAASAPLVGLELPGAFARDAAVEPEPKPR